MFTSQTINHYSRVPIMKSCTLTTAILLFPLGLVHAQAFGISEALLNGGLPPCAVRLAKSMVRSLSQATDWFILSNAATTRPPKPQTSTPLTYTPPAKMISSIMWWPLVNKNAALWRDRVCQWIGSPIDYQNPVSIYLSNIFLTGSVSQRSKLWLALLAVLLVGLESIANHIGFQISQIVPYVSISPLLPFWKKPFSLSVFFSLFHIVLPLNKDNRITAPPQHFWPAAAPQRT